MQPSIAMGKAPWYRQLYVQVLIAVVLAVLFGILAPEYAKSDWMKLLGDMFVRLIRMVITPIIFLTIVSGVAHVKGAGKVGSVGVKALVYFEIISTFALMIGLAVGELFKPGAGVTGKVDAGAVANYLDQAKKLSPTSYILHIVPDSAVNAFATNDVLQVLVFALFVGFALMGMGERADPIRAGVDALAEVMFRVMNIIMRFAPIGAFGAMAFTIGAYGPKVIGNLLFLIGCFYLTSIAFILIVLGVVARLAGFSILRFLVYIKEELLLVLGTSSSESALPSLMVKLERLGCAKPIVGLVVPTGYSFNLDGTNIYMTLAALFCAQALNIPLSLGDELMILLVAMLTSKGAAGVTGSGFVTLAGTLSSVNASLTAGMSLILGIDKFMSECRALTNLVGNGVACIVIAAWEGGLDRSVLNEQLSRSAQPTASDSPSPQIVPPQTASIQENRPI